MYNILICNLPSQVFIKIMDYINDPESVLLCSNILLDDVTDLHLSDDLIDYIEKKVDIKDIICSGSVRLLENYYNKYLPQFTSYHNDLACMLGRLDILKFIESKHYSKHTKDGLESAVYNGHIHILEHILNGNHCYQNTYLKYLANIAALGNHLDIIVLLINMVGEYCIENVIDVAATNGHRNIVEYLIKRDSFVCTEEAMNGAARNKHFDIVKLLYENGCRQWYDNIVDYAVKSADLNIVIWFDENKIGNFTGSSISAALSAKNPDIIKWLWENKQKQIIEYGNNLEENYNYGLKLGLLDLNPFLFKELKEFKSIFVN